MHLETAARALHAERIGPDAYFREVAIDTRSLAGGELFVALEGTKFDGHDFVAEAAERGAVAAMVSRRADWALPSLVVDDTTRALGRLAAHWRTRFDMPLAAITGSNGKTTVKQMLGAILARCGPGLVTAGNLNNHIGVPLMLLRLRDAQRYAVLEMGMNHSGEVAYLTGLARPTVAVITNAAAAHLEGLGSVANVARAKGEIFSGLQPGGVAVINADDPFAPLWRELAEPARCVSFGLDAPADVCARPDGDGARVCTPIGEFTLDLALPGRHNLCNALAAAAAALAMGATLEQVRTGLERIEPVPGRLQSRRGRNAARVLDDTYNANPASLRAALAVLAQLPGRKILALGDMAELGSQESRLHRAAGERARAAGVDRLLAVGPLGRAAVSAFGAGATHFDDHESLIAALVPLMQADVAVLVKGSRRMHMETVVQAICEPDDASRSMREAARC